MSSLVSSGWRMPNDRRAHLFLAAFATLLASAVYLLFCLSNGAETSLIDYPLDDAWIHQVYVRGLWTEGIPSYNPGVTEAGFTSPLWLLVNVPLFGLSEAVGATPVAFSKLGSLVFAIWTALAISRLVEILGGRRLGRFVAVAAVLMTPGFAFAGVSGMEVTLAAALIAQALLAVNAKRWRLAGVWMGLAGLARPETAAMVIVVCLFEVARDRRLGHIFRKLVPLAGLPALFALPWFVFNFVVTGRALPNTFYAKMIDTPLSERAAYYADAILLGPGLLWAATTGVLLIVGGVVVWRRTESRRLLSLIVAVQVVSIVGIMLLHPIRPDVKFYLQRYFYPFTILDCVLLSLGVASIYRKLKELAPAFPQWIAVVCAVAPLGLVTPGWMSSRQSYADHCRDIYDLHTLPAMEAKLNTRADTVIAVEGAGAARFFAERYTLDLLGLNYHPLVQAADDNQMRTCLIVGHRPGLFIVPEPYLPALDRAFELEIKAAYRSPHWSSSGGTTERVVVAATARPRPEVIAHCQEQYGE